MCSSDYMAKEKSNLERASKKWTENTSGKNWKAGVTGKGGDFCEGVAEFLGVKSCNPETAKAWTEGVEGVSVEDFNAAVKGKGSKWARRYAEKMGGVAG